MKTSFNIGGVPTVSYIGKKAFEDRMTWNGQGELVLVKSNAEDGTEITAVRALSEDGRFLVMVRVLGVLGLCGLIVVGASACGGSSIPSDTDARHTQRSSHPSHHQKQCVKNLKDGKETHAEQTFEKS